MLVHVATAPTFAHSKGQIAANLTLGDGRGFSTLGEKRLDLGVDVLVSFQMGLLGRLAS